MKKNIKLLIIFFVATFLTNSIYAQLASESKMPVTQLKQIKSFNSYDSVHISVAPVRLASDQPVNYPTPDNNNQTQVVKDKNKRVKLASDPD